MIQIFVLFHLQMQRGKVSDKASQMLFLILFFFYKFFLSCAPTVIGESCCGVPAKQVFFFPLCVFVCVCVNFVLLFYIHVILAKRNT